MTAYKMSKTHILRNDKGSAIVTVLFLFVALIGYTLYFIAKVRIEADIKSKSRNEATVLAATAKLRSILSTPANCNATFTYGAHNSPLGNIDTVRVCSPGGNCFNDPYGTGTSTTEVMKTNNTSWSPAVTLIEPGNVRLLEMSYTRRNIQTMDKPEIIDITLKFETKLKEDKFSRVNTTLEQYVVYRGGVIAGCPKAPSTIDMYGDLSCHVPWDYGQLTPHNGTPGLKAYRLPQVVGCEFAGNWEYRTCNANVLAGSFMYGTCINDGGWSTAHHATGPCVCISNGNGTQTRRRNACNNPAPDPGGLPCPPADEYFPQACTLPLATCP